MRHLNGVLYALLLYVTCITTIFQCTAAQQPGATCKRLLWFAAIGPEHVRTRALVNISSIYRPAPTHPLDTRRGRGIGTTILQRWLRRTAMHPA